jgi:hypothetical protein
MIKRHLDTLTDADLAAEFRSAAQQLGEAVINWMPGSAETQRLFEVTQELRSRGRQARMKLAPLLNDKDRFVRYYAARHLLGLLPDRTRKIIEENASGRDAIAGDAGMLLSGLDSGQYKPS